jgi:dipeptidyl aminopeptidase/acylaminoacyl peptidase
MRRFLHSSSLIAIVLFLFGTQAIAQEQYQTPPEALARLVDTPPTPSVSISPDRQWILLTETPGFPSIRDLAEPELRLAGMRINPDHNGPARTGHAVRLSVRPFEGGTEREISGLPADPRIGGASWSPDSRHLAFTLSFDDRIELWVADAATASARRLTHHAVNPLGGRTFEWLPDGSSLLVQLIPHDRGAAPAAGAAVAAPIIQESIGRTAPARTYQDLLQNAHDEAAWEYYMTSRLARIALDGTATFLGESGVYTAMNASPDGNYVLVTSRHRPFSYQVPWSRFPSRSEVLDMEGNVVHTLAELPLMEEVPIVRGSTTPGARAMTWRNDAPATLVWVEAQDGGDPRVQADIRDRVYMHEAPFRGSPQVLADLGSRFGGISWGREDLALLSESWPETRTVRTHRIRPGDPAATPELVFEFTTEDRYANPGSPMMTRSDLGTMVLRTDGAETIYLSGQGASDEGDRPFVAAHDLATGNRTELFRSTSPYFERPISFVGDGDDRLIVIRESVTVPPNYYVRDLSAGTWTALTDFPHPQPEMIGVQRERITYERADGLQLSAMLYLPAGYDAERDGPLPGLIWAYPREFLSLDAAAQVSGSPYQFTRVSHWGPVGFVTQGYAVLDGAAMPIVSMDGREANDTFIEQLVMNGQAAIDAGANLGVLDPQRVGVGGHSYGAFMTANLLSHSDIFRAGIARSGAFNRTLTPFGFQAEPRSFWEAPEIYFEMSPFMHAHTVTAPILLIHGIDDNNSGTFPMQSERYYAALRGNGKVARLVMLPHESHGYRARESLLHMLWEQNRWLERYVKNAEPRTALAD